MPYMLYPEDGIYFTKSASYIKNETAANIVKIHVCTLHDRCYKTRPELEDIKAADARKPNTVPANRS